MTSDLSKAYAFVITYHQVFESVEHLTYSVPLQLQKDISIGCFVEIPFGSKVTRGIVIGFSDTTDLKTIKDIISIIDENIFIPEKVIVLAKNIAKAFRVSLYRAFQLFVPRDILFGRYTPTTEKYILCGSQWNERHSLISKAAKKQQSTVEHLEECLQQENEVKNIILKNQGVSTADLKPFIDKNIIKFEYKEALKNPIKNHSKKGNDDFVLNQEQKTAIDSIMSEPTKPHLLYGVTGSGKTEVYIQYIKNILQEDPQAQIIVLVPEINLTPQLVSRFLDHFDNVGLWHSRLSPQEKLDQWMKIYKKQTNIVIGSRSALFVPVGNLKAIIIDEEHDTSYKQDKTPRYDVHTVAEMMQKEYKCGVIYGSATPRIESMYKSKNDIYTLSKLTKRFTKYDLPEVTVVDLTQTKMEARSFLSYPLQLALHQVLERKEQAILFLNRRGFAPSLTCRDCGWHHECQRCDIASTMHVVKDRSFLTCHCCGLYFQIPTLCPECGGVQLFPLGSGTQKIEEELNMRYPDARILRVDQDTTSKKGMHRKIYESIQKGEVDIIIGTQMIAKGLDAPNVTLVGVILADYGLHIPDFRAEEYSFQVLSQVAGRAGRHKPGRVIIQTFSPENEVIQAVQKHDYDLLYDMTLPQREEFSYPPYTHLLKLEYKHYSLGNCKDEARNLADKIKLLFANNNEIDILGPTPALILRRYNKYHYHILIKYKCDLETLNPLFDIIPREWIIDMNPYYVV